MMQYKIIIDTESSNPNMTTQVVSAIEESLTNLVGVDLVLVTEVSTLSE